MKLWHLTRFLGDCRMWYESKPWYENYELVVRAASPAAARKLAANCSRNEDPTVWLDTKQSRCKLLKPEGKPGVIVVDYWKD